MFSGREAVSVSRYVCTQDHGWLVGYFKLGIKKKRTGVDLPSFAYRLGARVDYNALLEA